MTRTRRRAHARTRAFDPDAQPAPYANARMYAVSPAAKADWHEVLRWVLGEAGLHWPFLDHAAPTPIAELYARDDLGLALMCGLPFALRDPPATLVAAPIPSPARYGGRPVYMTDFVVAADSPHRTLEDTFGGIVGYTLNDSMSGGVAPRHYLAALRAARGGQRLYRGAVGDLIHARGVIDAIDAHRIDVGPLDGYSHDLLRAYEPSVAARVRTVASTAPVPIPPLVATAAIGDDALARLRAALLHTPQVAALRAPMGRLLLAGFAASDAADYAPLAALARTSLPAFEDL